jgi:hypothetical protein
MAIFNKNSLAQISGFNNPILSGELVWNQSTYWNLTFQNSSTGAPVNLTGATISAQIVLYLHVSDAFVGPRASCRTFSALPKSRLHTSSSSRDDLVKKKILNPLLLLLLKKKILNPLPLLLLKKKQFKQLNQLSIIRK